LRFNAFPPEPTAHWLSTHIQKRIRTINKASLAAQHLAKLLKTRGIFALYKI
jgi:hypothetical protein